MTKRLVSFLGIVVLLAAFIGGLACNKRKNDEAAGQGFGDGGPPSGITPGGPGGSRGPIGQAMTKLFKGPQSLKDSIGRELMSDSPTWETIQQQTKEFVQLTASLSKFDPPKGSKESWTKMTSALSDRAAALDRAAEARNKDDALSAHAGLSQSCKACHQAHRGGPGGKN